MKSFLVITIVFSLIACQKSTNLNSKITLSPDVTNQIMGGVTVAPEDTRFKSVVGLRMESRDSKSAGLCTGTIIREDVILTAAHCLKSDSGFWDHIFIIFDNNINKLTADTLRLGDRSIVHSSYKSGLTMNSYDIALLKFTGGLPVGYKVAKLFNNEIAFKSGLPLTLVGYGVNSLMRNSGSGTLRHLDMKLSDPHYSETEFKINQWIRGICTGDSGGPAFIQVNGVDYVAGVNNRTGREGSINCIKSAYFARVDRFKSWIVENLNSL